MGRQYSYSKEISIAAELRKFVPRQRAVLFHGTQYPCSILKSNSLIYARHLTHGGVSFTRLFHVGIYWACLHRDPGENQGAVFVLDRDKLARDFRLMPYCWRGWGSDKSRGDFEAEELVFGRDIPTLHNYLLEVVWLPEALCQPPPIKPAKLSTSEWIKLLNIAGVKGVQPVKRHKPQQIMTNLRRVQTMVSQGEILTEAIRAIGTSEATYRRWEKDYSALTMKHPNDR